MNRYLKLWIFVAAAAVSVSSGCKSEKSAPEKETHSEENHEEESASIQLTPEQIASSNIRTAKVKREAFHVEVEALGEIASDTDRVVQIRPDLPGTTEETLVALGDTVEPGQVLVRYRQEGGEGGLKELKSSLRGLVVGLYAEPGSHIDPAVPQVTIADTTHLRCTLDVYEKDIARIKKGQPVRVKVAALPEGSFSGAVSYISPRVDEESRTVKVRVDVKNREGQLKFGMFVTGRIQVGERLALIISDNSIQNIGGETTVFISESNNTFAPRHIETGERSDGFIEVKSGLKEGETVVVAGSFILKSELQKGEMADGDGH